MEENGKHEKPKQNLRRNCKQQQIRKKKKKKHETQNKTSET